MEWNNYKNPDAGCDKYGMDRLKLAEILRDKVFPHLSQSIFIENGTLLGAWRNGKFIKHDDDFDFGIIIKSKAEIEDILKILEKYLPKYYHFRQIDSYADKIEIYDPAFGNYKLSGKKYNNANYHFVTVDLQFYILDEKKNVCACLYKLGRTKHINKDDIIPCKKITLENSEFPCPNNIENFLKVHYGYIGEDAKYCEKTDLYYKI